MDRVKGRLSCRHVDFLLCEPDTLRPILGIELDDSSHQKPGAYDDDQYKNELFAAAGLRLMRVPWQRSYRSVDIRNRIDAELTSPA